MIKYNKRTLDGGMKNMNYISKDKLLPTIILLHFIIFGSLHTIPFIINIPVFPIDLLLKFPVERWLVWVVPSVVLIKLFEKSLYINLKDMFFNKVKLKTCLRYLVPIILYLVGGIIFTKLTNFSLSEPLRKFSNIEEFLSVFSEKAYLSLIVPAIPEEIVFRGWIQNALLGSRPNKKKVILAIILSNIMFVIIHLPTFFNSNYSIVQMLLSGIMVFIVGSVFGIIFIKSKNILVPIFFHWLCDTITFTFYN